MQAVWALGLASVALFMGLGWYLQPLQPNIVALQFTFSPDAFQSVLDAWGPQGVQLFRLHLVIDDVLLLCYGAFGYLLVQRSAWFGGFAPANQRRMAALMPLAALCDAEENLHGYLTGEGVAAAAAVYGAAGIAASAKWFCLLLFALLSAMVAWRWRKI